jgi:hypothetical protein
MPSLEDRRLIIDAFYNDCIWTAGEPRLGDAWLGIYQMLLWYEHGYIHIREANDLRKNRTWQQRATLAEREIAEALGVPAGDLHQYVDRMLNLPRWQGMQRNNPLGNGLRILVAEVLRRWGDPRFTYEEEVLAQTWFPGIQMPGRSEAPKIDVVAHREQRPRTIISCKWSGRHDRMSDVTNECQEYKAAAVRRQYMDLQHFVITNEMDGQRSDKIINQPCIDGLVLVHLPLAERLIGELTPLMAGARGARRLLDLAELVQATFTW